jgi:predicted nucleotidyltransferase
VASGAPDVEAIVGRYLDRLRERIPIEAAYLYGSQVRGSATPRSDIDVAVVSPAFGASYHRDLTLLAAARPLEGAMIAALPFTVAEHQAPPRGSFLREIIKTGRRVA